MSGAGILRKSLLEKPAIDSLRLQFDNNTPIRHIVIENFLDESFAKQIFEKFPGVSEMKTHYKGLNEKKSEHSGFSTLDPVFETLHQQLSAPSFLEWLQTCTGIQGFQTIDDRLGYGLHQGANNSFLDIHIDYNIHPVQDLLRKLNLILFFNPEWQKQFGGNLELWDAKVENCIRSFPPVFNTCVIFECSDVSYHGYSRITVPEGMTRKSYYQYYFIPPPTGITYHDTVFRTRPQEPLLKKLVTPAKEFAKNTAKRLMRRLGMSRLLK
jgi:Rps23 Pro-64 3,4-dihydroxylase Tpa1-like proline 4-hydroxylase